MYFHKAFLKHSHVHIEPCLRDYNMRFDSNTIRLKEAFILFQGKRERLFPNAWILLSTDELQYLSQRKESPLLYGLTLSDRKLLCQ